MEKIKAYLNKEIIESNSSEAKAFCKKNHFGEIVGDKVRYSFSETLYLVDNGKMELFSLQGKKIAKKDLVKRFQRIDDKIQIKYNVFKDLRNRGYTVKTALKFGAEFRVYEKGAKPGKKHAKWIVFTEYEPRKLTWHEFSAKNRVAHSTKKNLLLAIMDEEGDITYYEVRWIKP